MSNLLAFDSAAQLRVELAPEVGAAFDDAARLLEELGHEVADVPPGLLGPDVLGSFEHVWSLSGTLLPVTAERVADLRPLTRVLRERGLALSAQEAMAAMTELRLFSRRFVVATAGYDVLLAPVTTMTPRPLGWFDADGDGAEVRAQAGPVAAALGEAADATSSSDYLLAFARLQALAREVVSFFGAYDLVLTPTLALPPVPVDWNAEADPWTQFRESIRFTPFTPVVNVTGQPAASLPLHWSEEGLPVGVQLIGRPAGEATILRVSAQLEQARPWAHRHPPVWDQDASPDGAVG